MSVKKMLREYFVFSHKERIAVIVLLIVIAAFTILPAYFGIKKQITKPDNHLLQQIEASKQPYKKEYQSKTQDYDVPYSYVKENDYSNPNAVLFQFDPNTIDANGWKKLGLRDKTIKTILNYVSKGGKFKKPEDIRKIWGLTPQEADRLIPYISIQQNNKNFTVNTKNNTSKDILFDANTATIEQLKTIPNIGHSLPYKIVNFREKLGGFINMQQVKETYGITDSIFKALLPYLHVLPTEIRKLNINTASEYELNNHPYIDKTLAKAITIRRSQKGAYQSVTDLQKIPFVTEELFNKIEPYLTVQ